MTVQPLDDRKLILHRGLRIVGLAILASVVIAAFAAANRDSRVRWLNKADVAELQAEAANHPDDRELILVLDHRLIAAGKYEQAFSSMSRLTGLYPNDARVWGEYAKAAAQTNRVIEALKGYQRQVQLDPHNGDAHATIGTIYIKAGLNTDGLSEIETARRVQAHVAVNVLLWAQALDQEGKPEEAWNRLMETININPTQDEVWEPIGRLAIKLNRCDEAEALMMRRISMSSMYDLPYVRGPLARLLIARKQDPDTLDQAYYIAKLGAHDKFCDAQLPLAEVMILQRDLNGARKVLENGLKMDVALGLKNRNPDCIRLLAKVADMQGRTADAAKLRAELPIVPAPPQQLVADKAAAAADPASSQAQVSYAGALEQDRQYGPAAEVCEAYLKLNGGDQAANQMLQRCRSEALDKLAQDEKSDNPPPAQQ